MITDRQANSTALSEVPKTPITHSRTAAGAWSTTVFPTA
ncbi:Uncharacterised protein [Mycobacteroides abscessus subsp. abscessus]|nr:Uncharacterised protein [Mycobacteroides abscessus subsp. abscessus]